MRNYQCIITINNRCRDHLRLLKQDIPWGEFESGPVDDIPPMAEMPAFTAQGVIGPAGTEGTVIYQVGDDANVTITIYFDVPTRPGSSNTLNVDTSNVDIGVQVGPFNSSGSVISSTLKVLDGRG